MKTQPLCPDCYKEHLPIDHPPIVTGDAVDWLSAAPLEEWPRRDFFVGLITRLSFEVSAETMQKCIDAAIPKELEEK